MPAPRRRKISKNGAFIDVFKVPALKNSRPARKNSRSFSKLKTAARVTAFAVCKIFAKGGFVVMTGRAARAGFRGLVHRDRRHVHPAARRCVAVAAFKKAVFGVAEIARNERARGRDVVDAVDLMTGKTFAARQARAAFVWRVALETGLVRGFAVRDDEIDAAARFVTGRAILLRVSGVAEFDAEAPRAGNFRVAFAAVGKIVCAEGFLVVMTRRAAVCRARVHRGGDLCAAVRVVTARAV